MNASRVWWREWLHANLSVNKTKDACVFPSRPPPASRSNRPDTYQKLRRGFGRMVETRIAPRVRVAKPAVIEYGGDKTPCTIRDISITGASLEVSQAREVPSTFILTLSEDRLVLRCRVVWRKDFRLGVAFD